MVNINVQHPKNDVVAMLRYIDKPVSAPNNITMIRHNIKADFNFMIQVLSK
jgi:hypothetical protein